jgi:beta-mannosidase
VKPRFCSEFGFQSFPSLHIIKGFVESDDDLNIASPVMESHQKNAGGNARIAETMFRYFRFPVDFGNFVYLSQVQQGLAIRTAVEYWRSLKPHCMGTLYWQLNDTWPVASWSGLDHCGGWKALHYMARRFFAPIAAVAIPDKATGLLRILGVNDTASAFALSVEVTSVTPAGGVTALATLKGEVAADRACVLGEVAPRRGEILFLSWRDTTGRIVRSHVAPEPYKALALARPGIRRQISLHVGTLRIDIAAEKPAFYVMAETSVPGSFSDNVIDLLPGETVTLHFTPDDPGAIDLAMSSLVIRDLYSSSSTKKD